jgi:hypothetical protein
LKAPGVGAGIVRPIYGVKNIAVHSLLTQSGQETVCRLPRQTVLAVVLILKLVMGENFSAAKVRATMPSKCCRGVPTWAGAISGLVDVEVFNVGSKTPQKVLKPA